MIRGRCTFHGIGQGLFHSGVLQKDNGHRDFTGNVFRFVYDCGSLSTSNHVATDSGTKAKGKVTKSPKDWFSKYVEGYSSGIQKLDLLVLSHLHQDHVNGVANLPASIGTLVMPYFTITDRLLQLASDDADLPLESIDFYLDPILYLSSGDRQIGRIIFIKGSEGPESPDTEKTIFTVPELHDGEDPFELKFSGTHKIDTNELEVLSIQGSRGSLQIANGRFAGTLGNNEYFFRFWMPMPSQSSIIKIDEFNKDLLELAKKNHLVSEEKHDLKKWKVFLSNYENLTELRTLYKSVFGQKSLNETSICLWHGYDCDEKNCERFEHCCHFSTRPYWSFSGNFRSHYYHDCCPSTFLTGDQLFTAGDRCKFFSNTFARERTFTSVFQIPHHGSKHNLSLEILPECSSLAILSYGLENSHGHPAASVRESLFLQGHEIIDVIRLKHFEYKFINNCHR